LAGKSARPGNTLRGDDHFGVLGHASFLCKALGEGEQKSRDATRPFPSKTASSADTLDKMIPFVDS